MCKTNILDFLRILLGRFSLIRHSFCVCISVFPHAGGIELTVFSAHFKVELDVVDIQSQRVERFGKRLE